jgi:hypothetical protein
MISTNIILNAHQGLTNQSTSGPILSGVMVPFQEFDRPFELRGESRRLIRSLLINWRHGKFLIKKDTQIGTDNL